jgi:hypothetical protein
LVHAGRTPEELARQFEPTAQSIRNWVARSDHAGRGNGGLTTAEREELCQLRRENRQLRLEREILSRGGGLVRSGDERDPCEGFRFVSDHQADYPVATMCRLLGVSPSSYYARKKRQPSQRSETDAALIAEIQVAHAASRGTYGAPRIHAELAAKGRNIGRKRVARLMREAGVAGVSRRRFITATVKDGGRQAPGQALVERNFTAEAPDRLWVADITYIPNLGGLYLSRGGAGCPQPHCRLVDGHDTRHLAGERISTGFVESAINQIVDKRMEKRQS